MSAKALSPASLAPAAGPTAAPGCPAAEGLPEVQQFHEDLRREYHLEAINAGFDPAQASEYARALSLEIALVAGEPELAPLRRDWFYQSRAHVVRRTFASGLATLMQWQKNHEARRAAAASPSFFALRFPPWKLSGKS
jgi:hypothetical protein